MKKLDKKQLQRALERIVKELDPVAVYLYGSHVYGIPGEDSDIDILIILEAEEGMPEGCYDKTVRAYRSLRGLKFPAELKVVSETEFEDRSKWISSIERKVLEKGQLLYESGKSATAGTERVG